MRHAEFRFTAGRFLLLLVVATASSLAAQDKSVRPGINKQFENPNVAEFVGKFERDGREPFDHRKQIVEACHIRPGMVVADIGTGTGLFTRMFSPLVGPQGRIYAVDISGKFVKHVEATAQANHLTNIVGVACLPDSVNLPPDSIDLAFICDTYHHFEFPLKTMRSIHRALRPGGQVVLIDFRRIPGKTSDWVMNHVRAGQDVFTERLSRADFDRSRSGRICSKNRTLSDSRKWRRAVNPSEIWIEQCEAARGIEDEFGTQRALSYLIGEKFLNFLEAADDDSEVRAELPAFVAEIKTIFGRWQLAEFLDMARQTEPFDPTIYEGEDPEVIEMERQLELRHSAADLLLVERAKEWLLKD